MRIPQPLLDVAIICAVAFVIAMTLLAAEHTVRKHIDRALPPRHDETQFDGETEQAITETLAIVDDTDELASRRARTGVR